jgi:hypothetical protein
VGVIAGPAGEETLIAPAHRIQSNAAEWRELAEQFTRQPDATADFQEKRFFPFRKDPVVLTGEVRVSRAKGLSLRYATPEERTVILDERGVLVRERGSEKAAPDDPRARAANEAMWHVLRFDLEALREKFDVYGRRDAAGWSLALVPRDEAVRRAIGDIFVTGEGAVVRQILLRRSAKQHIDIDIASPRLEPFSPEDVKRYFR